MVARGIATARDAERGIALMRRACQGKEELGCQRLRFFGQGP